MIPKFNIVLYKPEIPLNTGNIGRLSLGINAKLFIVKPAKFLFTDKQLKRSGLDYWKDVDYRLINNLEELNTKNSSIYYCTTKTKKSYLSCSFKENDYFVFGPESSGIPQKILTDNWFNCITIPMSKKIRSINLANSVAIVLYEAIRQNITK